MHSPQPNVHISPYSNVIVERFCRTLNPDLMCQNHTRWTESLAIELLGVRTLCKEYLKSTCPENLYDITLSSFGEFLQPTNSSEFSGIDSAILLQHLNDTMNQRISVPKSAQNKKIPFVHPYLRTCTHVFVSKDTAKVTMTQPYNWIFRIKKGTF